MIRRRVVGTLVSAVVAVPLLAAPAQAIPQCKAGYQCDRTYYSDATHDLPVGGFTQFCDGETIFWGTTTRFVVTQQTRCPD